MENEKNAIDNELNQEITSDELINTRQVNDEESSTLPNYEEEIKILQDKLYRNAAELENVRKRADKQIEEASKYAINSFVKDLINVVENLYRVIDNISKEEIERILSLKIVCDGVVMTTRELTTVFERYGIKRIHPNIGEVFDHNLHQAVSHVDSSDHQAGTIVQVLQAGYVIKDRLLNPAMVSVVKE